MMFRRLTVAAVAASTLVGGSLLAEGVAQASSAAPVTASHVVTAGPQKCPTNLTSGTVGGQTKCLGAGQQCQQNNAKDYTKFGFTCSKSGNRYQLSKKGAPAKAKPMANGKKH
jgi:hypothetical protein